MEFLDRTPNPQQQSQRPMDADSLSCIEDALSPIALEGQHCSMQNGSDWKPGKQEYAVIFTISVVSLMVALDATILVPVLPV